MKKVYRVLKLETKETRFPDGYHNTIRTEYFGVQIGYQMNFDTLEDAENDVRERVGRWEHYTIIPVYVEED